MFYSLLKDLRCENVTTTSLKINSNLSFSFRLKLQKHDDQRAVWSQRWQSSCLIWAREWYRYYTHTHTHTCPSSYNRSRFFISSFFSLFSLSILISNLFGRVRIRWSILVHLFIFCQFCRLKIWRIHFILLFIFRRKNTRSKCSWTKFCYNYGRSQFTKCKSKINSKIFQMRKSLV